MVSNPATGIESKYSVLVDCGNVTPEALKNALRVVAYFGLAVLPPGVRPGRCQLARRLPSTVCAVAGDDC